MLGKGRVVVLGGFNALFSDVDDFIGCVEDTGNASG